jgi:hypothetical protein
MRYVPVLLQCRMLVVRVDSGSARVRYAAYTKERNWKLQPGSSMDGAAGPQHYVQMLVDFMATSRPSSRSSRAWRQQQRQRQGQQQARQQEQQQEGMSCWQQQQQQRRFSSWSRRQQRRRQQQRRNRQP